MHRSSDKIIGQGEVKVTRLVTLGTSQKYLIISVSRVWHIDGVTKFSCIKTYLLSAGTTNNSQKTC